MSGNMYRRNMTLADLISGNSPATAPPVAPTQPAPASIGGEAGLSQQERSRLLELLTQPDAVGPAPEADTSTTGTTIGANISAAFADALGTYASILGGGKAPDFMKQLDNKRQLDKEARRSYQERLAKSKTDAGKLKANYILSADDRARERSRDEKAAKVIREQLKSDAVQAHTQALAEQQAAEGRRAAAENDRDIRNHKQALELLDLNQKFTRDLHDMDNKARNGDKPAEAALKSFSAGSRIVSLLKTGTSADPRTGQPVPSLIDRLESGEDPAEIRRELESELNQETVFGVARDMTRNLLNEEILRATRNLQKKQEAGPQDQQGFVRGGINAWDEATQGALPNQGP